VSSAVTPSRSTAVCWRRHSVGARCPRRSFDAATAGGRRRRPGVRPCKPPANERGAAPNHLAILDGTQSRFLALAAAPSGTRRHSLVDQPTPLHGGGQRFEPAAVHHLVYSCVQGFRDFTKPWQAPRIAPLQTFCKRTGWQKVVVAGSRRLSMAVGPGPARLRRPARSWVLVSNHASADHAGIDRTHWKLSVAAPSAASVSQSSPAPTW
jgi:hypothetical protein